MPPSFTWVQDDVGRERWRLSGAGHTWVERAGDGVRWCATVRGAPLVGSVGSMRSLARLLTWETSDGAKAQVMRRLRLLGIEPR